YDVTVPKDYTARLHYADGHYEVRLSDVTVQGYRPQDIEDPYRILAHKSLDIISIEKEGGLTTYDELLRRIPGIKFDYQHGDVLYRDEPVDFWINSTTRFNHDLAQSETALGIKYYKDNGTAFSPYGSSKEANKVKSQRLASAFNTDQPKLSMPDFIVNMFAEVYPIQDMKRVDLIPTGMSLVFGSMRPVLNFTTKGPADMVADRPYQLKLISTLGFQTPKEFYHQDYTTTVSPDLRSTLYWLPKVSSSTTLDIPADVNPIIIIEGLNQNGVILVY
ncbi:MAG: hypothetical protein K2M98_07775, partial [Muribaculum sp.]|nr:hypothetical protein [Muribaculum sp.]